jgi:hypothetical protein
MAGLQPQPLCEQVVWRGLRRDSEVDENGLLSEEVAQVLGMPVEMIPLKATKGKPTNPKPERRHIHAQLSKIQYAIRSPRIEGCTHPVRNRVTVSWPSVPSLVLTPERIPPEVEVKGLSINEQGPANALVVRQPSIDG